MLVLKFYTNDDRQEVVETPKYTVVPLEPSTGSTESNQKDWLITTFEASADEENGRRRIISADQKDWDGVFVENSTGKTIEHYR